MISEPASLRELPATIASLVGHDENSPFPGKSLDRFWTESNLVGPSQVGQVLMETDKPPFLTNQGREPVSKGPMKSMFSEGLHYIRRGNGVEEMYHLDSDPFERTNVVFYRPYSVVLERLRAFLEVITRKQ